MQRTFARPLLLLQDGRQQQENPGRLIGQPACKDYRERQRHSASSTVTARTHTQRSSLTSLHVLWHASTHNYAQGMRTYTQHLYISQREGEGEGGRRRDGGREGEMAQFQEESEEGSLAGQSSLAQRAGVLVTSLRVFDCITEGFA